jgi:hypothetical protein
MARLLVIAALALSAMAVPALASDPEPLKPVTDHDASCHAPSIFGFEVIHLSEAKIGCHDAGALLKHYLHEGEAPHGYTCAADHARHQSYVTCTHGSGAGFHAVYKKRR